MIEEKLKEKNLIYYINEKILTIKVLENWGVIPNSFTNELLGSFIGYSWCSLEINSKICILNSSSYKILKDPLVVTELSEYFSIKVKLGIFKRYFPSLVEYSSGESK